MTQLHDMKKLEIIMEGEFLSHITRLLDKINIKGYTVFKNLEGFGDSGYHEGQLLFNDEDALVMIMTVVNEAKAETIVDGLQPFFAKHPGALFVSDVKSIRKF